jgi:O-antigen/teichoic acid export membrane protein
MFANFIFNPILVDLAHKWDGKDIKSFKRIVIRQMFVIGGITLLAIAVALTIGSPILGMLFGTNLASYKTDLAILMVGGGMLALVNFYAVVITVMRYQRYLTFGYVAMAILAGIMANSMVRAYGIRGATVLYTILMSLQSLIFVAILIFFINKTEKTLDGARKDTIRDEAC